MTTTTAQPQRSRVAEWKPRTAKAAGGVSGGGGGVGSGGKPARPKSAGRIAAGGFNLAGGYESATRDRTSAASGRSVPAFGSPNLFLNPNDRAAMRKYCRALKCNDSAARGLIQTHQDITVADGGVFTATTKNAAFNEECNRHIRAWLDNKDPDYYGPFEVTGQFTGWQTLRGVVQSWDTHGDELIALVTHPPTGRLSCQRISGEQIVNPGGALMGDKPGVNGKPGMVGGVELTGYGAPAAFHVAEYNASGAYLNPTTQRISARYARLCVNPKLREIGQVRGEPGLQAIAILLERTKDYVVKHNLAATIATLFGLLIKTNNPAQTQEGMQEATADQPTPTPGNPNEPREVELGPAFIQYLFPNETVEQVKPEFPRTNFKDFVLFNLAMASADMGIPLPLWFYEIAGLTASNLKSLFGLVWRRIAAQQDELVNIFNWIIRAKIRDLMDAGIITRQVDDWDQFKVTLPMTPVMDFKAEVDGHLAAINGNLSTKEYACQALGTGDSAEIDARREIEKQRERDMQIEPVGLPGAKAPGGSAGDGKEENAEDAEPAQPGEAGNGAGKKPPTQTKSPVDGASGTSFLVGDKTIAADLAKQVAAKSLPALSGKAVLEEMIGLTPEQSARIIDPAEAFKPDGPSAPAPAPAPATTNPVEGSPDAGADAS